jgi:hypothetical protein
MRLLLVVNLRFFVVLYNRHVVVRLVRNLGTHAIYFSRKGQRLKIEVVKQ